MITQIKQTGPPDKIRLNRQKTVGASALNPATAWPQELAQHWAIKIKLGYASTISVIQQVQMQVLNRSTHTTQLCRSNSATQNKT
jgi:hypothetical protein